MTDRTGVGSRTRVRTLARQEQKKLTDGEGRERKEEEGRKKEESADFSGAVFTSQPE